MIDGRSLNGPGNYPPAAPATRLWRHVERTEDCWLWYGATDLTGYGQIRVAGRLLKVHRLAYELEVGPIPEGFEIDHLCRVRNCVRPDHLEAVTLRENRRRANVLRRTIDTVRPCREGHPIPAGKRSCPDCDRLRAQAKKRALDSPVTHADRALTVASERSRVA